MKICVYAISLNEEKFVDRFIESCKEADYVVVADTGSTDNTVELLKEKGVCVHNIKVNPWRFDDARNIALNCVPDWIDVCVSVDLDEILLPGWRKEVERAFAGGADRVCYNYVFSWLVEGTTPNISFLNNKIHTRNNFIWKHPCHEVLQWCGQSECKTGFANINVHHYPDNSKSRGSYIDLLEKAVLEDPLCERMSFYYGRELFFYNRYKEAKNEFIRYLGLEKATWQEERAAAKIYISKCLNMLGEGGHRDWLFESYLECPTVREPLMEIVRRSYNQEDWATCFWAASKALEIRHCTNTHMVNVANWGAEPHDYLSFSAWKIGANKLALTEAELALEKMPDDIRLKTNVSFLKKAVESTSIITTDINKMGVTVWHKQTQDQNSKNIV